jgi:hypothetical protein
MASAFVTAAPAPAAAAAPLALDTLLRNLAAQVLTINNRSYIRLEMVGKGGSSKVCVFWSCVPRSCCSDAEEQVYKVLGPDLKVYALKRVRAENDEAMSLYLNEVCLVPLSVA